MAIEPTQSADAFQVSVPRLGVNSDARPAAGQLSDISENESAVYVSLSGEKARKKETPETEQSEEAGRAPNKLTAEEKKELQELQARDREVRTHEQAHLAALGPHKAGGANFSTEVGPDGRQYAVGGEVPVDVSPEKTPEETIRKAQTIRRAALAPADPSGADRSVAASAAQMEAEARAELAKEASSAATEEESSKEGGGKKTDLKALSQYRATHAGASTNSFRSHVDIHA